MISLWHKIPLDELPAKIRVESGSVVEDIYHWENLVLNPSTTIEAFEHVYGKILEQVTPYHGGNLFPLAAAGTVYLRDPRRTVGEDQLNGGKIITISKKDWGKILPLLKENESLFGINVKDLLAVDGVLRRPEEVYRKVVPLEMAALTKYDSGF